MKILLESQNEFKQKKKTKKKGGEKQTGKKAGSPGRS
jgi:hypothetical protein